MSMGADTQRASPVVGALLRAWNDRLDDATRERLKPYGVRLAGTAGSDIDERRRREMLWEWVLGTLVPTWLETAGMHAEAEDVRVRGRDALADVQQKAWQSRMTARERLIAQVRAYVGSASVEAAPAASAYESAAYAAAAFAAAAADTASGFYPLDTAEADAALAVAAFYDAAATAATGLDADTDAYAAYAADAENAPAAGYAYVEVALAPTVHELQKSAFGLLDRLIEVHHDAAGQ